MVSFRSRNRQDPIEAGKARKVWREFVESRLHRLRHHKPPVPPADADRFVVYFVNRPSANTEFVLRNCMLHLGESWGLQILTPPRLEDWIGKIVSGWSGVHVDPVGFQREDGTEAGFDELTRLESFWESMRGRHQLFIDDESIICHSGIDTFLSYDYVGAPWGDDFVSPWCRYGSGGLSLRRKEAMLRVCRECNTNPWMIGPEDVFFSIVMRLEGERYRLPPDEVASSFSVEQVYFPEPFSLHRTWEYIDAGRLQKLLERVGVSS